MAINQPITSDPLALNKGDIRLLLLEAWENGDVASSMPGNDHLLWMEAAAELRDDLEIDVDAPYIDRATDILYLRANHGFPIEMHWQSPEARAWLHKIPERAGHRNAWNDLFIGRSIS